ncbi:hypothetical protein FA15DRAFT_659627 [Coprinopsis marcescibilis]|uniref:Uncharacterized protein n=1 Tax=Coprinopsis marcescibilis TaxID=230819 RepID=A0A5C3KHW1_COPMA|nr:hypothetical protein FA15DRAFT_659627 [Coprinopsis marcescibilis]
MATPVSTSVIPSIPIKDASKITSKRIRFFHTLIARLIEGAPDLVLEFEAAYGIHPDNEVNDAAGDDNSEPGEFKAYNRLQAVVLKIGVELEVPVRRVKWEVWADQDAVHAAHKQAYTHLLVGNRLRMLAADTRRADVARAIRLDVNANAGVGADTA